jgi:iron-sulfur cluster assembly accessory protein
VRRLRRRRALITVTQDAINQMNSILEKKGDEIVRYELRGGGCGGLIAEWKTEPHHKPEQGEITWGLASGKFVIDEATISFIDGGVVNYDLSNFMPNFIVSVPDKGQCGCGSSFVVPKGYTFGKAA